MTYNVFGGTLNLIRLDYRYFPKHVNCSPGKGVAIHSMLVKNGSPDY